MDISIHSVKRCSLSKVLLHYINNKNNINVTKKEKTAPLLAQNPQNYKNVVSLMNVFFDHKSLIRLTVCK